MPSDSEAMREAIAQAFREPFGHRATSEEMNREFGKALVELQKAQGDGLISEDQVAMLIRLMLTQIVDRYVECALDRGFSRAFTGFEPKGWATIGTHNVNR